MDKGKGPLSDIELTFKSDRSIGGKGADFRIAEFSPNVTIKATNYHSHCMYTLKQVSMPHIFSFA